MKKILVLLVLLTLFACTPKGPSATGLYADPVEVIHTPIHVKYGPGVQRLAYSMNMKAGSQSMKMSFDTDYDIRQNGDSLVADIGIKNMKVRMGGKSNAISGSFMDMRLETETSGKVIQQTFSSKLLNKTQLDEMKKSIGEMWSTRELVEQSVKTGSVLFSGQDILASKITELGLNSEGFNLEYTLAGYVMHNGEKALLLNCLNPDVQLTEAKSGTTVDFGFNSYMLLRPENLQCIYSETVMDISIPDSSEKILLQVVMNEK